MPKVNDLTRLLAATAAQDWTAARTAGLKIADDEERIGHHSAAQQLRGALHPNGMRSAAHELSDQAVSADPSFLATALTRLHGPAQLADISLRRPQRSNLSALKTEWVHRLALEDRGVPRRRKLLFCGPPGCGKSLTAQALGAECGLPTFVVRLDSVVGAFLGQTALRIRELFRFAEVHACVLLLDEIDALGKRRGNAMDVGELDRIVISLMQELEHAEPMGFVIGTSNLPRHLDDALYRRFDAVIDFPRPRKTELRAFASLRAKQTGIVSVSAASRLTDGAESYAEAERRIADRERSAVLGELMKRK